MIKYNLGHYNKLTISSFSAHGAILDGGNETILMPMKYTSPEMKPGDEVEVFVYLDQEDRLVATTEEALAEVGEFAFLQVAWVNSYGAFLNWGLTKDLFVPYREQNKKMAKDARYMVFIYIDDMTGRIVATNKLDRYIQLAPANTYQNGDKVEVQVWKQTDIGYKVIIDGKYNGLIYKNEVFQPIYIGNKLEAYIKNVRPDGRIDVALQSDGKQLVDDSAQVILKQLEMNHGFLPVGDKSDAEEIYDLFHISKKAFKKAIGALYKQHIITITPKGIRMNS